MKIHLQEAPKVFHLMVFRRKNGKSAKWLEVVVMIYIFVSKKSLNLLCKILKLLAFILHIVLSQF